METISNRWIGLAYKWLLPLALVASIGVAAVTVISARSEDSNRTQHGQQFSEGEGESEKEDCEGRRGHGKFGASVSALAELVGTDVDGLKTGIGEGKTLGEIAEENGIDAQTVIDALVVKAGERFDAAVEAGKLTDEEAETKKSEAATRIEDVVNKGFDRDGMRGWGKGRWRS